ncbi:MAG TPA: sialidase family protein [bacterium]|jgi:hypothetical protein
MRTRRRRIFGLAMLVVLATLASKGPRAFALSAVNLSNTAGRSYNPTLGLNGVTLMAAWQDTTPGSDQIFMRRSPDTGMTWNPAVNVSQSPGYVLEYDWNFTGRFLFLAWSEWIDLPADAHIFLRKSTDGGATFQPLVTLSPPGGTSRAPRIAVSGRNVYVAWQSTNSACAGICFRRSNDGGQSFSGAVSIAGAYSAGAQELSLSASGPYVFALWMGGTANSIYFTKSTDGGANFSPPVRVNASITDYYRQAPRMAVAIPNVYVVWSMAAYAYPSPPDHYLAVYTWSNDSGATFDGGIHVLSQGDLSYDSTYPEIIVNGTYVFVIWNANQGARAKYISYVRSVDGGATWSTFTHIADGLGWFGRPGPISWLLSGTDIHVAWISPPGSTSVPTNIFYRRGTNAGTSFGTTVNLSGSVGSTGNSGNPRLLTAGRDVFAVWEDDTPGNLDIMFVRSQTGGF